MIGLSPTKKIHFIVGLDKNFGEKPFILPHLISILSAKLTYPDHEIYVHYEFEPSGEYWKIAKEYVSTVKVNAPKEIFGNRILSFAHSADVLRLEILIELGGIYFDLDTLVLRSISDLPLDVPIMGYEAFTDEHVVGLCNAFIAAPPNASFLKLWYESYEDFNANDWSEHSVRRPYNIALRRPELIHIEPRTSFFSPHYDEEGLRDIFERRVDVTKSRSIHLWESLSWKYMTSITLDYIVRSETTYAARAKEVLDAFRLRDKIDDPEVDPKVLTASFERRYDSGSWGKGSGSGSLYTNNIDYMAFVAKFLSQNGIKSVVDLGCGDWQFSQYINWNGISYLGIDAVPGLIERNSKQFGSDTVRFEVFTDFLSIPESDLLICKDVLQHWPNSLIEKFLLVVPKKFRYMLITNDEEPFHNQNSEINIGEWRSLDLRKSPFLACL